MLMGRSEGTQALLSICPPGDFKYVEYSTQFGLITGRYVTYFCSRPHWAGKATSVYLAT